jgi:hypothetical protein
MLSFSAKRVPRIEKPDAKIASNATYASLISLPRPQYSPPPHAVPLSLPIRAHITLPLPQKSPSVAVNTDHDDDARLGFLQPQILVRKAHPLNTDRISVNNGGIGLPSDRHSMRELKQKPITAAPADAQMRSQPLLRINSTKSVAPQFKSKGSTFQSRSNKDVADLNRHSEQNREQVRVPTQLPSGGTATGGLPVSVQSDTLNQLDSHAATPNQTSTIHLDGSALGRWALLHLERALTKPPSGMTGVDPRATIPRSHVVPF